MKRTVCFLVFAIAMLTFASVSMAKAAYFPDEGWHKGAYIAANVGMMQTSNAKHSITGQKFDGTFAPAFGLTVGWDIADWIGPMLQLNYATTTSNVGDPNNTAANVTYGANTFPPGTFPVQNAREHVADVSIFARATLPYFLHANWQPNSVKIIPYAKLGGTGHGLYVNASAVGNKIGAFGGGPAFGLGCEFYIWKGIFLAVDTTESLIIQKAYYKNITTTAGAANLKLTDGGLHTQFLLSGLFGWHF